MGTEGFEVSTELRARPQDVYRAWLDSRQHGEFTGDEASVDPRVGGRHTAWGGYIEGTILELEPGRRIVQSWRTTEFPAEASPSRLELRFEPLGEDRTLLRLIHTDIPEGQGESYRQGWDDHYFQPMSVYFEALGEAPEAKPATRRAKPAAKAKKAAAKKPSRKPQPKKKKKAAARSSRKAPAKKKAASKKKKPARRSRR